MSRSKKTPTEIVFYEPKNDAEFYKLCSGALASPVGLLRGFAITMRSKNS